ncbi:MAG TPA: glycosyltransferase N-terminal domain-containing protein, partial [Bacteroidia bacterium]|nr:glycosyltransferase N-terminal domain-containing protein [Bacteroidia bacterium]
NYLKILHQRQIPVFHLSLKMHTDSRFLKFPQRFFYARAFSLFNRMYVQTQLTADLLRSLGIPNAEVSGNTRIPRVLKLTQEQEPFAEIREFIGNRFCIIGGSLLPKDEEVFLAAASVLLDQNIVWIAVPHEINSKRMAAWERHYSGRVLTYSNRNRKKEEDILWIDNTGMLSRLYRYAHLAFVGGGYDRIGIHNILEPASFSCPIAFGPRHRNYTEALELLESGGASMVHNSEEWISLIRKYVSQETLRKKDGHGNRNYLLAQTDASENILAGLRKEGYLSTL